MAIGNYQLLFLVKCCTAISYENSLANSDNPQPYLEGLGSGMFTSQKAVKTIKGTSDRTCVATITNYQADKEN